MMKYLKEWGFFIVSCLFLTLFACSGTNREIRIMQIKPTCEIQQLNGIATSFDDVKVTASFHIANPSTSALEINSIEYTIQAVATGWKTTGKIKASSLRVEPNKGINTPFEIKLRYKDLMAKGEKSSSVSARLTMVARLSSGGNELQCSANTVETLPMPQMPRVDFRDFQIGRFSNKKAELTAGVYIVNPNPFKLKVDGLKYKIFVNEKEVGSDEVAYDETILPNASLEYDLSAMLNEETYGKEVVKLLKEKFLKYRVEAELTVGGQKKIFSTEGEVKLEEK